MQGALGRVRGVLALAVATAGLPLVLGTAAHADPAPPTHTVTVTGTHVTTWPAYSDTVERYAVSTATDTGGSLTLTATTSDQAGTVTVDGRPVPNGHPTTLTGLASGDEVAVAITDAAGTTHQSWTYLPPGFPTITSAGTGEPGHVLVGLSSFFSSQSFQAVLDDHGVPTYVREAAEPNDFTAQPHGPAYTVFEPVKDGPGDTPTEYGYRVRELDVAFHETGTRRLAEVPDLGITAHDTDFHDVAYTDDGHVVLVGYHRSYYPDGTATGRPWLDAVIQVTDLAGNPTFTWTTRGHTDPSEGYVLGGKGQDYAHINSVQVLANGDLLASFRNLGQLMRIATTAHDGFQPGDVEWRMGGQRNDFTFDDPGFGGFCAQHDARILPNGHLLLFDNGSRYDGGNALGGQTADMCPDPNNPNAPRVARPQTRVVEYALDEQARTATRVWSYVPQGRYAAFAGDAQRLDDGTTLVGWANAQYADPSITSPIVSEVSPAGAETWSLTAPGWFSYRAFRAEAPDAQDPTISVEGVQDGASYPVGTPLHVTYGCTDAGGSTLQSCEGTIPNGATVPAESTQSLTVTATDGAGNTTTRTIHWGVVVVDPLTGAADLAVRLPGHPFAGSGTVHAAAPRAGVTRTAYVRLTNTFDRAERAPVRGSSGNARWRVTYRHDGRDVTRRVVAGLRTPSLAPHEHWLLRVDVRRLTGARPGGRFVARVDAGRGWFRGDTAGFVVAAR
ncbi:MAG: aryl-sulfate sulfotransferase [Nocardioides sp.]